MDGEERTNKNECLLYICLRGHSRDKSVVQLAFRPPPKVESEIESVCCIILKIAT